MQCRHLLTIGLVASIGMFTIGAAQAVMGSATIVSRVDKDGDKKLSLAEVRAAAARQYELIKSKNGDHVTMLQLGGRLVPADLKEIGKQSPGVETAVSKQEYLALAEAFFDKADTNKKAGAAKGSGMLDLDELGSTAGKKLVGLLQ